MTNTASGIRTYDGNMPEEVTDGSGELRFKIQDLERQLAAVESERDGLRQFADEHANREIASWLEVVGTETRLLGEMQNSISWRLTRPLRAARTIQIKVARVGVPRASQLAVADLRRRFRGRRR